MVPEAFADSRFGAAAVARLRVAFERSLNAMLFFDDHRRFVTGNAAGCEVLGVTPQEISWLTIADFTPPGEEERVENQWQALMTRGALEGWYPLDLHNRGTRSVEFSATANVLPGRHMSLLIPLDEASTELAGGLVPGEVAWTKAAVSTPGRIDLTGREREVMTLIAAGRQTSEIGERLFIAPETVKSHVGNAMGKLGAHTRAHAVAIALVSGQIAWEP
jgi:PAS domain S-box-containing protein